MMYSVTVFLVLFGTLIQSIASEPKLSEALQQDFKDFENLIPKAKITAIAAKHYVFDKEFKNFATFVQSDEFNGHLAQIQSTAEFKVVNKYLEESGLQFDFFAKSLQLILSNYPVEYDEIHRSVNGFVQEVIAVLPKDQLQSLFDQKLTTSPEFKYLFDRLANEQFNNILVALQVTPQSGELLGKLKGKGLDIEIFLKFLENFFGWVLARY